MSFRSWGAKQNPIVAVAVATTQTSVATPAGFAGGGDQVRVVNGNSEPVIVAFYKNASGAPTLAVPASGSVLVPGNNRPDMTIVVVPPNTVEQVSVPDVVDSVATIASSAGTVPLFVQRGDGSY